MKLLIVTGFWPTRENTISGIFVVQQIAALVRAGCHVTIVVPTTRLRRRGDLCAPVELGLDDSRLDFIKSPFIRLPEKLSHLPGAPAINTFNYGINIRRIFRLHYGEDGFDGCIVHGLRYAGLSLPIWRKYIRGRTILVVHGADPFFAERENIIRFRALLDSASVVSDDVVLVGRPLEAYASFLGLPRENLRVVPNGTDLPPREQVSFHQRSIAERRRVVSVSNLVPLKGIDNNLLALAAATRRYPDLNWEYRVIGDGPYRRSLVELALRLGIANRVKFIGRLSYDATMNEIAQCDVFSLPSWGEAFGIVYLEAMARGRVVIGCRDNGAADIITDDMDGLLVKPQDLATLETALVELLCNPERCSRLGAAARTTAEKFSWDENAKRVLMLLNQQALELVS